MKGLKLKKILLSIYHYFVFFLMTSFIITCCILLFGNVMMKSTGIALSEIDISLAARLTFLNVAFLSLIFTVIDAVRRKIIYEAPIRRIKSAAERMVRGDFSVRIRKSSSLGGMDGINEICDCFNKMAEELSSIETISSDFISNVSHELKTPLTAIGNYAAMLSSPVLSDEDRIEYAKAVSLSCTRLSELVSNILRLNKLENSNIFPEPCRYELGEQLCECLISFEYIWEQKHIEIHTQIKENIFVKADAEMMKLVWNNLFSNAFKFTDDGGRVSLTLDSRDGYAHVRITDTGCGISQHDGAHIFDKFYQADASRATDGNGLGLALVKRVIDITGAEISVSSVVGEGTSFEVKLLCDDEGV